MRVPIWIPLLVAALLALMGSVYTVTEGHGAIVLNLGRVVRTDMGPGLHFKWPLIESAREFDRRLTVLDAEPERYLTSENKDVSVDFFAIGRIENLRAFYRATGGNETAAIDRLAPIIKNALRNEINSRTLSQVVSGDRSTSSSASWRASTRGGHARRAHPRPAPQAGRPAHRRRSHRPGLSPHARAAPAGREPAARRGRRGGAEDRGQRRPRQAGDRSRGRTRRAEAARRGRCAGGEHLRQAANKDPGFYAFQRSLEAYRASFKDGNTVIVLDKNDPFLQYMKTDR
jgi:membrane protease subunit HflC